MAGEWYSDSHQFRVLSRYLAATEPGDNGWWDAFCPIHEDSKRSAGFNFDDNRWSCRAGCGSGTIDDLVKAIEAEVTPGTTGVIIDLDTKRKGKKTKPAATIEMVNGWAAALLANEDESFDRLDELRGIGKWTLEEFQIGWSSEHEAWMIPVMDGEDLLNVRLYNPTRAKTKIWNWGGMDPSCLYPAKILKEHQQILICEGEWDALIANDRGFPAVTGTTGALQWAPKWNAKFKGKDVVLVYDRDAAGDAAANKIALGLEGTARSIAIAELPLPWTQNHGADVSDFFHKEGRTPEEFRTVIAGARVFAAPKDGEPARVSVKESFNPALSGKPMTMTVSVVGKGLQTHLVPKEVTFSCNMSAGPKCHGCPMADSEGMMTEIVDAGSNVVLALRDVSVKQRNEALRELYGIHKCGIFETDVREYQTTEALVVRTSVEEEAEEDDHRARTVVNVGEYRTATNSVVRLTGTTYPSPSGQESIFLAWRVDPVESSLDTYKMTREDIALMKRFRPRPGQSPIRKLTDISRRLADHVTHIYERLELHIAMDLVFHSALSFRFGDDTLERGWLELLVVGDARTGKSEVATKLTRYYRYGRVVSCESASIPGLLGAVKPLPGGGKGWTLEWGAIPLNDRRLVALDEVGGLTPEQIGQMSSMRSSGLAEIVKAEREVTHARTRLIWMGNPRNNTHGMASFLHGVQAVVPLIGSQEDVARFDMAMSLGTNDVSSEVINRRRDTVRDNPYTSEACHALLSWVWSRDRSQVVWAEGAEDEVYKQAMRMGEEYVPDPPLIQMQNVRVKLARISVAIAARLFSTSEDYESILVRREHVLAAARFLDRIYGMETFGYREISVRRKSEAKAAKGNQGWAEDYIRGRDGLGRFLVTTEGHFRRQQMEEQLNTSKEEASAMIMALTGAGMLRSLDEFTYRATPALNEVLRGMRIE